MSVIKEAFRPRDNRFYINNQKTYRTHFILMHIGPVILVIVAIILQKKLWWLIFPLLAILLFDYFVIEYLVEKYEWKLLKKYYSPPAMSGGDKRLLELMDEYAHKPTPELKEHIATIINQR